MAGSETTPATSAQRQNSRRNLTNPTSPPTTRMRMAAAAAGASSSNKTTTSNSSNSGTSSSSNSSSDSSGSNGSTSNTSSSSTSSSSVSSSTTNSSVQGRNVSNLNNLSMNELGSSRVLGGGFHGRLLRNENESTSTGESNNVRDDDNGTGTIHNDDTTASTENHDNQMDGNGGSDASRNGYGGGRSVDSAENYNHDRDNNDEANLQFFDNLRQDITPYNNNIRAPACFNVISLETLEEKEPEDYDSGLLHVQFLRLKSGTDTSMAKQPSYMMYNRNKKDSTSKMYSRMLMCRDLSCKKGRVLYLIEGKSGAMAEENQSNKLWLKDGSLKSNGVVSVGRSFTLLAPNPIENYIQNDVPIVKVSGGIVALKDPKRFDEVLIDYQIKSNVTRSFCVRECEIKVRSVLVNKSTCSGMFCDKQATSDPSRTKEACGCYSMNTRASSLVLTFTLKIQQQLKDINFTVSDFTSCHFWSLFLKEPINTSAQERDFDNNDRWMIIRALIKRMIEMVNNEGGWTVIGWYRKGESADANVPEDKVLVEASTFQHHVSRIVPTNSNVMRYQRYKRMLVDFNDENITGDN